MGVHGDTFELTTKQLSLDMNGSRNSLFQQGRKTDR